MLFNYNFVFLTVFVSLFEQPPIVMNTIPFTDDEVAHITPSLSNKVARSSQLRSVSKASFSAAVQVPVSIIVTVLLFHGIPFFPVSFIT